MKNKLIWILSFAIVTLSTIPFANADSILDFLAYAENTTDTSFGYTSDDKLNIKNINSNSVDIESPVIRNGSSPVKSYLFNISDSEGNGNLVAHRCFYEVATNGNKFTVELDMSSIDKNKTYYVYAIPVDGITENGNDGKCSANEAKLFLENGISGNGSTANGRDPCFNMDKDIYGEGDYCENHGTSSNGGGNNSNAIVYSIRNISHSYNGKDIRLTWESLADTNVEIFLRDEDRDTFKKLGTVNSERREYTFAATHNGDHILKLRPTDGSQEINYTAHYIETVSPEVKPVDPVKPVVVGPKENIMMIVFGTIILYAVYRVAARKRS